MHNLIEYSNNFQKKSGSLYQLCRIILIIKDSGSFKFKSKFLYNTNDASIVNAKIAVPLKYLSNFWRNLEMLLINCEINLILNWSANCVISNGGRTTTFAITDANQDNTK